ncbi:MAG: hypothetical protein ABJB11_01640 [Ferruginibacter sp.]
MRLALNFLLILLVELPIVNLFFKRKKRQHALYMAFLINLVSWAVAHVIIFTVDVNIYYVAILVAVGEAIAYNKLLECNWKKSIIISLVANSLSFFVTQIIPIDDLFTPKQESVRPTAVIKADKSTACLPGFLQG